MSEYSELAQLTDERYRQDLQAEVALGLDAEKFLESKVGLYLIERAMDEAAQAMQAIKSVDPDDSKAVRALQNQIFRAESFVIWLHECKQKGDVAQNTLMEQE